MPLRGIPLRGNPAAPALPPPHIPGPRRTGAVRVPGTLAGDAKGGEKGKSPLSLFPRPPLLPRGGRRRPGRPLRHFLPGDKGPAGTRAAPALFPPCRTCPFPPAPHRAPFFPRAAPAGKAPGQEGRALPAPIRQSPRPAAPGRPPGFPQKNAARLPSAHAGGSLFLWLFASVTAFLPARAPLLPAPGKSGPCGSRLPQRGAARARPAFPPCRRA